MERYGGERVKILISVTKRGNGNKMVDFYKKNNLHYDFICLGTGAANSEILDYLGLETNEKDVVITMIPQAKTKEIISGITEEFGLSYPGKGIVFTIPLTTVSARVQKILCKNINMENKETAAMESDKKYELILTILNRGYIEEAMQAAKKAGAKGGTILHARRVGFEDMENIFGFTIQPEKDVVMILTESTMRADIMKSITEAVGINTEAKALLLSLPVDEISGI